MKRTEKEFQTDIILDMLTVVAFASLYAWGGIEGKFIRRYIAPLILVLRIFWKSGNVWSFVQVPLSFITLSMGYGADTVIGKITRRFIYGSLNGLATQIDNFFDKKFVTAAVYSLIVTTAYVWLGTTNPFPARVEETVLGALLGASIFTITSKKEKV